MPPIRHEYERHGVTGFYAAQGATYRNPHELLVARAVTELAAGLDLSNVLDLSCGSGEATIPLLKLGAKVSGADPYTAAAYTQRTGLACENLTFEQIAGGALAGRRYSLVVCSYALHLAEVSRFAGVCQALGAVAGALLIVTPHKKPAIRTQWGWTLEREQLFTTGTPEFLRCGARLYRWAPE